MTKKLILTISLSVLLAAQFACNKSSDEDYSYEYVSAQSVQVLSFRLSNDSKVLDSLQNVFFTIDLANARIFNADSLPYGTNVTKLVPVISAVSTASTVEIIFRDSSTETDSIVNYLETTTDSIDFTYPVRLKVVSESKDVVHNYEIKVNVHKMQADSLAWSMIESAPLPTSIAVLDAQRTTCLDGVYYCLTSGEGKYCVATTTTPDDPAWQVAETTFPFTPDVNSLAASSDALYILDTDGILYTSTDFAAWTSTGEQWHSIYGAYTDQVMGCADDSGQWQIASYPSQQRWAMPAGFPVEGASQPDSYDTDMAYTTQMVIVGGVDADGELLKSVWGYDGEQWGKISDALPVALESPAVVTYGIFNTSSSTWVPRENPALVLIGGRLVTGAINRIVYYSPDFGLTWKKAPDLMQLNIDVPTYYGSSAFAYSTMMQVSRATSLWLPMPVAQLPANCGFEIPAKGSRVSEAPTEWECPAIYVFGGYDAANQAQNSLWRGVILRYTYLQPY